MRCLFDNNKFTPKQFLGKHCRLTEECRDAEAAYLMEKVRAAQKKKVKQVNKEHREWVNKVKPKTHSKEYKADLQREVNKLARMIDAKFGFTTCIDCGRKFGNQCDAAHFNGVGSNNSIRYNLHNLHSAASYCNQFSDKHHSGYETGLSGRYGIEYLDMVKGLPAQYHKIKLSEVEVVEKLKLVRKLIRDFDTMVFSSAIQARQICNTIIGIYTENE